MDVRRPQIALSVAVATLSFPLIMGAAILPTVSHGAVESASSETRLPNYKPLKETGIRSRIGGRSRGENTETPMLVALVPDHVAFTVRKDPSLCWYLSNPTSRPVTFTLVDSRGIRPVFEESLDSPVRAGVHCIGLKQYGVELKEQEQYRWFVTLVWNPDKPSQDIVAGGMIERVPFAEACVLNMPCTQIPCEQEAVFRYAESGLWYDAIACLLDLIAQERDTRHLQRMLDHLLRQAGLDLPSEQITLSKKIR